MITVIIIKNNFLYKSKLKTWKYRHKINKEQS